MPKRKIPLEELDVVDDDGDYVDDDDVQVRSKRRHQQRRSSEEESTEADLGNQNDSSINNNGVLNLHNEGDRAHDVNSVVKLILAKDVRGQNFQKQHINQYLTNKRFNTDSLLDDAIAILENVYGLTLVDAPTIKQEKKFHSSVSKQRVKKENMNDLNGKGSKKQPPRTRFFLASKLLKPAQDVLGELWMKQIDTSLDKTKIGDSRFFIPRYNKSKLPKLNSDLVKTGIMMLVTTLVVLSENHIMESQLVRSLKKFGISDSINMRNSNLNMNLEDILKELVNREYLNLTPLDGSSASTFSSSGNDKLHAISLGRRSLTELAPLGVYEYIKTLYGSDFSEVIAERTKVTLERAYGADWEVKEGEESEGEKDEGEGEGEGAVNGEAEILQQS